MNEKVFCIGLSKTGTSSLAKALEFLGYHVGRRKQIFKEHFPDLDLIQALENQQNKAVFKIIPYFDAFVDNPWPLLYRDLAKQFPEAKFILTIREEMSWLESAKAYFGNSQSEFRRLMYGQSNISRNESLYLKKFQDHNQEVVNFFIHEPKRLLVLPLEAKNKWELLSSFLNIEAPAIAYPQINRTKRKEKASVVSKRLFNPLYWEILTILVYARMLTLFYPFKVIAKRMSSKLKKVRSEEQKNHSLGEAIRLSEIVKSLSKKLPFRAMCFEQALCMQMLLQKRGISSEIAFGLKNQADKLAAHAWCICQEVTLTGGKGKEKFNVIKRFGNG